MTVLRKDLKKNVHGRLTQCSWVVTIHREDMLQDVCCGETTEKNFNHQTGLMEPDSLCPSHKKMEAQLTEEE